MKKKEKQLFTYSQILSIVLLVLGILLLIGGFICLGACPDPLYSLGWFFVAALLLIPGSYSLYVLIKALYKLHKRSMRKVIEDEHGLSIVDEDDD